MQNPSRLEISDAIKELQELGFDDEKFRDAFHPEHRGDKVKISIQHFGTDTHTQQEIKLLRVLYYGLIQGIHSDLIFSLFGKF